MKVVKWIFGATSEVQSKRFSYILIGMLLVLSYSLIVDIIFVSQMSNDFTSEGLDNFFIYFDTTIKIGATFLVLLTIWLTLERIKQTDKQIGYLEQQITSLNDNNRFNNFYRHKDEFVRTLSESKVINLIAQKSGIGIKRLLFDYHQFYYGRHYKDFVPQIIQSRMSSIEDFYTSLKKSAISSSRIRLSSISTIELESISVHCSTHYLEITKTLDTLLKENPRTEPAYSKLNHTEQTLMDTLAAIYFNHQIFVEILQFDGKPLKNYMVNSFLYHYELVCKEYGVDNWIVENPY